MVGLGNVDNTSDVNKPVSTATQTALNLKFNTADTSQLNLTSRFATKLNYTDTSFLFTQSDTNQLNLTSRFNTKQNTLVSGTNIKTVNSNSLLGSGNVSVGTVTNVTIASSTPMSITNNTTTPEISMPAASASVSGFLQATAFSLFESKQTAISLTTTGSSGAATFDNNFLNIPNYTLSGLGGVPTNRTITINGTTQDLSANNTYNVGTLIGTDTVSLSNRINLKFNTADTSQLNLTSRFAEKQNTLSGTGFVKASGTNITYDNSSYLRTGLADSSYLKLTGGTLTGALTGTTGGFNTSLSIGIASEVSNNRKSLLFNVGGFNPPGVFNTNSDGDKIILYQGSDYDGRIGVGTFGNLWIKSLSTNESSGNFSIYTGNSTDARFNINPQGNSNFYGTLGVTGATTLGSTLAVTGNITEGGNNVLTNLDTASLSSRIDAKVGLTGNEYINGQKEFGGLIIPTNGMQLTATGNNSNKLIGINASSFVGEVTLGTGLTLTSNVLNASTTDTISLSNRINLKYDITGGTISGKAILNDSARFEGNVLFKKNMGLPIVKISNADYTATTANHTIIYTVLTADKTLTIPNASDAIGIKYIISIFDIPEGNEALTLVTPSLNLFVRTDGESSSVDIVGGYCTTIQSDGTKWYILSYAPMY